MSSGKDGLLSRWSRRKLAADAGDEAAADEELRAPETPVDHANVEAAEAVARLEAEEGDAGESAGPLPRIEDLTADSDLSAFLRKGVPKALKSAAIRKMWSLDPAIRDYVGPSENAWDFNQPGSMPGFGPLDAGERVVNFLSKVRSGLEQVETAADTSQEETPAPEPFPPEGLNTAPEDAPVAPPEEQAGSARNAQVSPGAPPAETAEAGNVAEERRPEKAVLRPRHGSAMPR